MELNCAEGVRDGLAKHFGGERVLTIGRAAILTRDHGGRAACHYAVHAKEVASPALISAA